METLQEIAFNERKLSFENEERLQAGNQSKRERERAIPHTGNRTEFSLDLARELQSMEPKVTTSPWPAHEHVRGYAVMILPFSSGDLLGLRVWPQNDFAPYASVWHCTPEGGWSIYSDGPSLKTTCPRYWGPSLRHAGLTGIDLTWTSPHELRVEMESPRLVWSMSMGITPLLRNINRISAALPLWTWKSRPLLRIREWMVKHFLDMGDLRFSFVTSSGHDTVIMPQRMFLIESSEAVFEGQSLGEMVRLDYNPAIGGVLLPSRPTFVIGQAHVRIKDREEYRQTRSAVLQKSA